MTRARISWLLAAAIVAMLIDIAVAFKVAPEAAGFRAPLTQRILYFHVPAAWAAYLAFGVTALAGGWRLAKGSAASRGRLDADALALASAEVGTVFSLIALFTGLVWSQQEFVGYSPLQDAKVITLVVVILSYLAYFALRASQPDPDRRARLAAVYGILALLGVPLSYFASKASVHPDFTAPSSGIEASLAIPLLFSTVAFTLLYAALTQLRHGLALVERAVETMEDDRDE